MKASIEKVTLEMSLAEAQRLRSVIGNTTLNNLRRGGIPLSDARFLHRMFNAFYKVLGSNRRFDNE